MLTIICSLIIAICCTDKVDVDSVMLHHSTHDLGLLQYDGLGPLIPAGAMDHQMSKSIEVMM
jgi:hypothetical protein